MKMIFCYLVLVVIMLHAYDVRSDCCHDIFQIVFAVEDFQNSTSCSKYDAEEENYQAGTCKIKKACADGKTLEGFFCGVGTCNVWGCNCDYGCIANFGFSGKKSVKNQCKDVANTFMKLHNDVYNIVVTKYRTWNKTSRDYCCEIITNTWSF